MYEISVTEKKQARNTKSALIAIITVACCKNTFEVISYVYIVHRCV